ncbi:RecR protein [Prochlorococcus marinus subsp. pastoris str. CCMP1986]|uniref:Recombination protein RecR n=1 Tax=Prochlorococcus marinus subsp. pastoris (strain CCMP1986 / NIES-2087 / MED4) TaxID=59919 RepID=RECR_PROMP|nr:recombination mediator RecR [Prochlorococcus marinus]Q7V0Z7.1 RecName: Full=Recombination protein RecR [Prochlorococcus marinus subsp. pastoris str. CCMP1986]KGF88740.1 Recombination protein RecR [Prochlorococcus marinus str. EQPAC1]MDC3159123.1 recombination mediator RecR [Prochlorococcus sp. AH-716-G10]CAE19556.1 RecR protein [Prochlorococcus marinus subsp. pastoris str. CCMP1986]
MITFTKPLSKLIGHFEKFPGIGPRTAQRLALFILKQPESSIRDFSKALLEAHSNVGHCKKCFNLTSEEECEICRNTERNQKIICVVAETKDLLALERSREFKGTYHVIGGLISPMDSISPELLEIRSLVERVSKSDIDEIILALTPSVEGDTTSLYIGKLLTPFTKVTRIAYGLPMGSELEYVDEVTLARALEGRTNLI